MGLSCSALTSGSAGGDFYKSTFLETRRRQAAASLLQLVQQALAATRYQLQSSLTPIFPCRRSPIGSLTFSVVHCGLCLLASLLSGPGILGEGDCWFSPLCSQATSSSRSLFSTKPLNLHQTPHNNTQHHSLSLATQQLWMTTTSGRDTGRS